MSTGHSPSERAVNGTFELLLSYGPPISGWIIAMLVFMVFGWIVGLIIKVGVRHMKSVLEMGEGLREAMKIEKEKCEEECRKKDELIAQLIKQQTEARAIFLQEAKEREEVHRRAMEEERRLREELAAMTETVAILREALDNAKNLRRNSDDYPRPQD